MTEDAWMVSSVLNFLSLLLEKCSLPVSQRVEGNNIFINNYHSSMPSTLHKVTLLYYSHFPDE